MINNSTSFCVIGNCQSNPISIFVEKISPQFKRVLFPAIHLIDLSKLDRIWEILDKVDIIIHQPISDSFGELGIESLMLKYPDKKYVSFPSVYFDGYFPYLGYLRRPAGGTVKGVLGDYHDFRVLEAFLQGKGKKEICAILNSKSSKKVIENINRLKKDKTGNHVAVDLIKAEVSSPKNRSTILPYVRFTTASTTPSKNTAKTTNMVTKFLRYYSFI